MQALTPPHPLRTDVFSSVRVAGDVLFLAGITMTIGVRRTLVFFFKRKQARGNLCFFSGIALVFLRWAVIGMVLQVCEREIHTAFRPFDLYRAVASLLFLLYSASNVPRHSGGPRSARL